MSQRKIDANNIENKTITNMGELKKKLIEEMKGVVTFLEGATVCNEESILILSQHFDNFRLSLKYLPIKNSFTDLPTEIKTQILGYLCDYEAFKAASVCQEWKVILKPRIYENSEVIIGRHCKNWFKDQCFNPEEMLKASLILKLDIPLKVCHPLEEVDTKILAKALTSAPELTLDDTCICCEIGILVSKDDRPVLAKEQGEEWMKELERKCEPMEKVVLKNLDLTYLKDRMLTCLLKKVKTLTLIQNGRHDKVLNFSALTRKLRQNSTGRKMERLNLYFEYNGRLDAHLLADALCTVEKVDLGDNFYIDALIVKRLFANMSTGVTMKTLIIRSPSDSWSSRKWVNLISPMELRNALSNMEMVQLEGEFSLEQLEVARSLPRGYAVLRPKGLYCLGIN